MGDLPYFSPGDRRPRSASQLNAMIAAAREHKAHHEASPQLFASVPDLIQVVNNTGYDLDRYAIVGLSAPVFDMAESPLALESFLRDPVMIGELPRNEHRGRFAILEEPVLAGQIAKARATGFAICLVSSDVEIGDYVDIDEGGSITNNILDWVPNGSAYVLWCGAAAGLAEDTKLAVVRLLSYPGPQLLSGRLAADLDAAADPECGPSEGILEVLRRSDSECGAVWTGKFIFFRNRDLDASASKGTYARIGWDHELREWGLVWLGCSDDGGTSDE